MKPSQILHFCFVQSTYWASTSYEYDDDDDVAICMHENTDIQTELPACNKTAIKPNTQHQTPDTKHKKRKTTKEHHYQHE